MYKVSLSLFHIQNLQKSKHIKAIQIQQSSTHAQNANEICNQPQMVWGNSLSIPSAHQ